MSKIKHLEQYLPKAALGSILPKAVSFPLHVSLLFNWYPEFAAHSFHSIFGSCTYTKRVYEMNAHMLPEWGLLPGPGSGLLCTSSQRIV